MKIMRILTLKIAQRIEGGDGFLACAKVLESVSCMLSLRLECVLEFAMILGLLSSV